MKAFVLLCVCMAATVHAKEKIPVTGQPVSELEAFDSAITQFIEKNDVPGLSVAIAKDGKLVYARGFGWADQEAGVSVEPKSLFRIASISKPITAMVIMKLVEEGKLKLSDPILPYLKKFGAEETPTLDPRWKQITIEHLLRHTAGFDRDKTFDPMFMPRRFLKELGTPVEGAAVIRFMLGRPLDFDPGTRYAYSNLGYLILGRVIEEITGQSYEQATQSLILKPAGATRMKLGRTRLEFRADDEVKYHTRPSVGKDRSVFPQDKEPVVEPYGQFYIEAMDAHGGWIASAADLVRFASALDRAESPLLKPETFKQIDTISDPPTYAGGKTYYGLGWTIDPKDDGHIWRHSGLLGGTRTTLFRAPGGIAIAALCNGQPENGKTFRKDLDELLYETAKKIEHWPTHSVTE